MTGLSALVAVAVAAALLSSVPVSANLVPEQVHIALGMSPDLMNGTREWRLCKHRQLISIVSPFVLFAPCHHPQSCG